MMWLAVAIQLAVFAVTLLAIFKSWMDGRFDKRTQAFVEQARTRLWDIDERLNQHRNLIDEALKARTTGKRLEGRISEQALQLTDLGNASAEIDDWLDQRISALEDFVTRHAK